jgi:hypothetical protein
MNFLTIRGDEPLSIVRIDPGRDVTRQIAGLLLASDRKRRGKELR